MDEEEVIKILCAWLEAQGWETGVSRNGPDIVATRHVGKRAEIWIVEAKGAPKLRQQRGNYFLNVLGQILQRMDSCEKKYSVAFPDVKPYTDLWDRIPRCAKHRTCITALFVSKKMVREVF